MLSQNLKLMRQKSGYTQEEAAEELHVVRQTVSKWESGASVPDAESLLRLSKLYSADVSELLGENIPEKEDEPDKNAIAESLAKLNEQLAAQSRRWRLGIKIVSAIGIIIALWGAVSFVYGIFNYQLAIRDTSYSPEVLSTVLSGCVAAFQRGAKRILLGAAVFAAARIFGHNK